MKKKYIKYLRMFVFGFLIATTVLLAACSGRPNVDWELSVTGAVSSPTVFTFNELADLPQMSLTDVLMEKTRGEDEFRSFDGVALALILNQVGAQDGFSSITARAADGYAVEITSDELIDGIVALKDGGDWIVNTEPVAGPIRLVFPATPANRWVFQVVEIVVNP